MIDVMVEIEQGRIARDCGALRDLLRGQKDGRYVLSLKPYRATRSSQANRRYWALLTIAAQELGYDDVEELHEGVALKFLKVRTDDRTGLERRLRTPKLNTAEFAAYSEQVERFFLIDLHLDLSGFYQDYEQRSA